MIDIINDDVLKWAADYNGPKFHALLTDPPYHLLEIVKRFGKPNSAPAKFGKDGVYARASKGFMGQTWDGGDIAFDPETWAALGEHLLPGAFGASFASARGWHRLAVAIEDAGFIIHPSIFVWAYGSGFPKATRIDNQIDRQAGVEQKVVGKYELPNGQKWHLKQSSDPNVSHSPGSFTSSGRRTLDIYGAQTDLAKTWENHRYGLQALKPSAEPIIIFQKPFEGRPLDNITQNGAGALNIGATRIGLKENDGRWPANLILSHSPDCKFVGTKTVKGYVINRWTDNAHPFGGGAGNPYESSGGDDEEIEIWNCADSCPSRKMNDSARYFYNANWSLEIQKALLEADPVIYESKANGTEREAGLENVEAKRSNYRPNETENGYNNNGLSARIHRSVPRKNIHPAVKPLALNRYLASLLLPPKEYAPRRLLVPFAGVMSEAIGAMLAGWEEIIAIEMSKEYCEIGSKRIEFWKNSTPKVDHIKLF